MPLSQAAEAARIAAQAASAKQATGIVILDVGPLISITDLFLICSGRNERQVATIVEEIERREAVLGRSPRSREGEREMRWVLLDYGDFVVHVFNEQEREFYELERLWADAERLFFEDEQAKLAGGEA